MNLYCTGFEWRPSKARRFFRGGTRFTLKTVDRSCFERPPAQYVNARQLISNSRPNGLRLYVVPRATTYIKH